MAAQFMTGTPEEELERLMQEVPGFHVRKSGIAVSRLQSKKGEMTCGKMVPLSELTAIFALEIGEISLTARMEHLTAKPPVSFFLPGHKERFCSIWKGHGLAADLDAMCAAVYLLSADLFLYKKAVSAIETDMIRFRDIFIRGVDLRGYILFHTAKGLYCGTKSLSLSELTDPELVDDEVFGLIIAAFLIRRYGKTVLETERREIKRQASERREGCE